MTRLTKKEIIGCILGACLVGLLQLGIGEINELHNMSLAKQAQQGTEGLVMLEGQYESNGLIVTEDGHEWIYIRETPLDENTRVNVVFRTNNLPEQKWEIVTVQEVEE